MSYELECSDNDGFDDQLTTGKLYKVLAFQSNSVLITNDNGVTRYYGESKFRQAEYQD